MDPAQISRGRDKSSHFRWPGVIPSLLTSQVKAIQPARSPIRFALREQHNAQHKQLFRGIFLKLDLYLYQAYKTRTRGADIDFHIKFVNCMG